MKLIDPHTEAVIATGTGAELVLTAIAIFNNSGVNCRIQK